MTSALIHGLDYISTCKHYTHLLLRQHIYGILTGGGVPESKRAAELTKLLDVNILALQVLLHNTLTSMFLCHCLSQTCLFCIIRVYLCLPLILKCMVFLVLTPGLLSYRSYRVIHLSNSWYRGTVLI